MVLLSIVMLVYQRVWVGDTGPNGPSSDQGAMDDVFIVCWAAAVKDTGQAYDSPVDVVGYPMKH